MTASRRESACLVLDDRSASTAALGSVVDTHPAGLRTNGHGGHVVRHGVVQVSREPPLAESNAWSTESGVVVVVVIVGGLKGAALTVA